MDAGIYSKDKFDLAVLVGIVSKKILDKKNVKSGDIVLTIPSNDLFKWIFTSKIYIKKI